MQFISFCKKDFRRYRSDHSKTDSVGTTQSPSDLPSDKEESESDIQGEESEDADADADADVVSEKGSCIGTSMVLHHGRDDELLNGPRSCKTLHLRQFYNLERGHRKYYLYQPVYCV